MSERNDVSRQRFGFSWRFLRWATYRLATIVSANTELALVGMASYVPTRKLRYLPNPVSIPTDVARLEGSRTLLSVGRLVAHKNHGLLIEAFSALSPLAQEWTMEILGEGDEREALEVLIGELGLEGRVRLGGWVPDPEAHLLSAAIFAFPSSYEGMPNALIEAMSYGLPCVVSDSLPGVERLVVNEATGLLFDSGSKQSLIDCLRRLMEDEQLRVRMGRAARAAVVAASRDSVLGEWDKVV